jgi:uncharacterized protein (TIGR03382 family)
MTFDPHVVALIIAASGVGFLMTWAGLGKNALEWRRRDRFCPSCGRAQRDCRCR